MFVSQTSKNTFEKWVVFLSFLERPIIELVPLIKKVIKNKEDICDGLLEIKHLTMVKFSEILEVA